MTARAINSVNFLRSQSSRREAARRRDKAILFGSGAILGVCVVVTAAVLGWQYVEKNAVSTTETAITSQQALINQLAGSEANYLVYTNRLDTLRQVLEARQSKAPGFAFIQRLLAPQLAFDQIVFDSQARELKFLVQADTIFVLDGFLQTLQTPDIAQRIDRIKLSEIKRNDKGGYSMQTSVVLKQEGQTP
jgi:hypothetical protein